MVLIQGRGLDHHGWDSVLNEFTNRPIVLIDHRGTGRSTAPLPPEWSTQDFAKDVVATLNHAGIDRAHVYGHSMGGRIAQWLGAEHADRIITLTIGAPALVTEPDYLVPPLALRPWHPETRAHWLHSSMRMIGSQHILNKPLASCPGLIHQKQ